MFDVNVIEKFKDISNALRRETEPVSWPEKDELMKVRDEAIKLLDNPVFQLAIRVIKEENRQLMLTAGQGREKFKGQNDLERYKAQVAAGVIERLEKTLHDIIIVSGDIEAESPDVDLQQ